MNYPESPDLDRTDKKILKVLSEDGRISWRDLAGKIDLSLTPTLRRVRRLEEKGFILGYVAMLDEERLAGSMNVFVSITLERQSEKILNVFESRIADVPEIMSCFLMTGGADYLLRVVVRDLKEYREFLINVLTKIPGVDNIQSSFALKPVILRSAPTIR